MSAFVVSQIKPSLNIDSSQRFIFGLEGAPEPLGSLARLIISMYLLQDHLLLPIST